MTTSDDDQGTPWLAFFVEAKERFANAQVEDPEISARRIIEEVSGFEGAEFVLGLDTLATVRGVAKFDEMVARRLKGEPLQYVVGRWGFRNLDLMVDSRVLIPRPETETVAQLGLDEAARLAGLASPLTLVDLGGGSGAIGLSLAYETKHTEVWISDISPDAVSVLRANLAGLGNRATGVRVVEGSWFEPLPQELLGTIGVIVSNPPYVADDEQLPPVVDEWEPSGALRSGPTGLEDLLHIVTEAPRWLRSDGALVLEMAPHQTKSIAAAASELFVEVEVHTDLSGRERAVVARHRR